MGCKNQVAGQIGPTGHSWVTPAFDSLNIMTNASHSLVFPRWPADSIQTCPWRVPAPAAKHLLALPLAATG